VQAKEDNINKRREYKRKRGEKREAKIRQSNINKKR
jgi:hypothetical protein